MAPASQLLCLSNCFWPLLFGKYRGIRAAYSPAYGFPLLALDNLAFSIWDRMHDFFTPQIEYPLGTHLQTPLLSLIISPPPDAAWFPLANEPLSATDPPVPGSVDTTPSPLAAAVPTLLPSVDIRRCFGCSKDDATRLSFPLLAPDAPEISLICSLLGSSPLRTNAPGALRQILLRHDNILLKYWKKKDRTLYYATPLDGACGYYALAQVSHLKTHGTLLKLDSSTGRQTASAILNSLQSTPTSSSTDGLCNIQHAVGWIQAKYNRSRVSLDPQYHLESSDYHAFSRGLDTTLFAKTSPTPRSSSLSKQDDPLILSFKLHLK